MSTAMTKAPAKLPDGAVFERIGDVLTTSNMVADMFGKRALEWKLLFIEAFNRMEAELRSRCGSVPAINLRDPASLLSWSAELTRELQAPQYSIAALQANLATLAPKAAGLDRLAASTGSENISDTAKALGVQPMKFFAWLKARDWIFRRYEGGTWRGNQGKISAGYFEHLERQDPRRADRTFTVCLVTAKGRAKLAELIAPAVMIPADRARPLQ